MTHRKDTDMKPRFFKWWTITGVDYVLKNRLGQDMGVA